MGIDAAWFYAMMWNQKRHFYFEAVARETFGKKKKNLYLAFVDLERVFDRMPRDVV